MSNYYCVFVGSVPENYNSFEEVQNQIHDFHDLSWAKFATRKHRQSLGTLLRQKGLQSWYQPH
ncbi:hypothetical protein AHAS_Ahas13G0260000 [Arachis hypogaea]